MKAKGINFKFLMLHIDSMMMSDVVLHGEEFECWRYIKLHMKYLKEECNLSYERAIKLISKETLDKLINDYYLVEVDGESIKLPWADENWKKFKTHQENSIKGGKKTQENKRKKKEEEELKITPEEDADREAERIAILVKSYELEDYQEGS